MELISIINLVGVILSFIAHGWHIKNSKCNIHVGFKKSCCGCNAETEIKE